MQEALPHLPISSHSNLCPSPCISALQPLQGASTCSTMGGNTTPPSLILTFKPHPPPCILFSATPAGCQHLLDHSQQPRHLPSFSHSNLTRHPAFLFCNPCKAPASTRPLAATAPPSFSLAIKPHPPPCTLFSATLARCQHLLDCWQQPHANGRHARVALRAAAPPSYLHRAQEGHGPAARPAVQQGALHCCIARFAGGHVSLHFDLLLLLHCRALPSHLQRETA